MTQGYNEIRQATLAWADAFCAPMPAGLTELLRLADADIHFTDPFNDVRGRDGLAAILTDMTERCVEPRFVVLDVAASERAGYIRWRFTFRPVKSPDQDWEFTGMSEIHVDPCGLITAQHDHWDSASQLLAKLPLIGWPVRRIARSLSVTPPRR